MRNMAFVVLLSCLSWGFAPHGSANMTDKPLLLAKKKSKQKPKKRRKKKKNKSKAIDDAGQLALGGGFNNVYPPMLSGHVEYFIISELTAGAEFGYVTIPLEEFSGSSSYMGIDTKYYFGKQVYAGLGLGKRSFSISTKSNLNHELGSTEITWNREVEQTTISPRVGWRSNPARGNYFYASLGVLMPQGSTLVSSRDVTSIEGVPDEILEDEEQKKADDVAKITHATMLQVEFKYMFGL